MSTHSTAIVWLRRDLRLADNPALTHALAHATQVIAVYIHAPDEEAPWAPGAASLWWLHHSLSVLQSQFTALQGRLLIRQGNSLEQLQQLIRETDATLVCWNRVYEPALTARDTQIKATLKAQDIEVSSFNASLLFEPWAIQNQSRKPFRVFTPFWKHCAAQLSLQPMPLPVPDALRCTANPLNDVSLNALQLLPTIPWDVGMQASWTPGEAGAQQRLQRFIDQAALDYKTERDRPDKQGTSLLSPHLHFGEIGPRQIVAELTAQQVAAEAYVRELGWREFSFHLLYHFPHTPNQSLDVRFDSFPWQKNAAGLKAWQRGRTGIP